MPITTDDFNRADEAPLGKFLPNFPNLYIWDILTQALHFDLISNQVGLWDVTPLTGYATYLPAFATFAEDQEVSIALADVPGGWPALALGQHMQGSLAVLARMALVHSGGGPRVPSGYEAGIGLPTISSSIFYIRRWIAGTGVTIASALGPNPNTFAVGTTVDLTATTVGSNVNLTLQVNGVTKVTFLDNVHPIRGGQPGFFTTCGGFSLGDSDPNGKNRAMFVDNWSCTADLLPNGADSSFLDP